MSDKNRLIFKSVMMLLAYAVIMAALFIYLNGWSIDKWKTITWAMFMAYGIRSCYLWFHKKLAELNDKD